MDLDQLGRRHADNVRSAVAGTEPPPLDSLTPSGSGRSRRGIWAAVAAAVVVVAALLPVAVLRDGPGPSDQPAVTSSPAAGAASPTTAASEPSADAPESFDIEAFVGSKLGDAFGENHDRVGVVILVPAGNELDVEPHLSVSNLPELKGYTYVPADVLEAAAERFAEGRDTEPLEGEWVGYGLIPEFDDSPTSQWVEALSSIPSIHVARVDVAIPTAQIPPGWDIVAQLPVDIADGAIVEAVDDGIVVLQPNSTELIGFDGSWSTGAPPPLPIPTACCGSAAGLPAGQVLVLVAEGSPATWIFDIETSIWRQADPRPTDGYVLGSVLIDGDLYVVTAAARTGGTTSSLAAFDVATGQWRQFEEVPSPISVGGVTTDGDRVMVAGTQQGPNNNIIGDREPVAYQYLPDEGWSQLPDIPIDGQASTVAWVEGTGLLAWNYNLESALLDQSGTWRQTGTVPMPPAECYPRSFPTVSGIAGFCGGIALFDATTESWNAVRHPFDTRIVATDTALYGLFQTERAQTQLITYPISQNDS